MGSNKGLQNEALIAEYLNGKKYSEINANLQTLIRDIFGAEKECSFIQSGVMDGPYKPDIYIRYKGQTRFLSIKHGRTNEVHHENIKKIILFLRKYGVSKETQKTILLYQYGDGTLNGTGKKRLDNMEVRMWLNKELQRANDELNDNLELINAFSERALFQGIDETADHVDYIYFGSPEYGKVVSKKQVMKYIDTKSWHFMQCLHIGPIFLKPHARYANREIITPEFRERVDCSWPNLADNLDYIAKRFTF